MADQDLLDKIDAYLLGKMPQEEASAFGLEIQGNPDLAEKVDLQRITLDIVGRMFVVHMKEKARQWREAEENQQKEIPNSATLWRRFRPLLLILGLLLPLAGAFLFCPKKFNSSTAKQAQLDQEIRDSLVNLNLKMTSEQVDSLFRVEQTQKAATRRRDSLDQIYRQDSLDHAATKKTIYAALAEKEWERNAASFGRERGIRSGSEPTPDNALLQAGTAIDKKDYRTAQGLLESIESTDKALYPAAQDMLAYVYARQGKANKAVTIYKRYMTASKSSDKELLDWTLLHYYLADYPQYKTEVHSLLDPMTANTNHQYDDFQEDARRLKTALVNAGLW